MQNTEHFDGVTAKATRNDIGGLADHQFSGSIPATGSPGVRECYQPGHGDKDMLNLLPGCCRAVARDISSQGTKIA
jgi:hypothetical protein